MFQFGTVPFYKNSAHTHFNGYSDKDIFFKKQHLNITLSRLKWLSFLFCFVLFNLKVSRTSRLFANFKLDNLKSSFS